MKNILLLVAFILATTANAQINFGEKPDMQKKVEPITYDGRHNIVDQKNNGSYNLKHLIGQDVTYIGMNDKVKFVVPNPTAEEYDWKYKEIDSAPLKYKTFRIVDEGFGWICLFETGKTDSIFARGYDDELNTNFIVQKHYDLAKTIIGKTYRNTGLSRRLDFWRDYKTRKVYSGSHNNAIGRNEDLKCIDVFVDTVHYNTAMDPGNEDWTDNVETISGSRLCFVFESAQHGKIFCPVEESEILDPEHAQDWLNLGPVLTPKKAQTATPKRTTATRKPIRRGSRR